MSGIKSVNTYLESYRNAVNSESCAFCKEPRVAIEPTVGGFIPVCKWHAGL